MGFLFKSRLEVARAETRRNQALAADPLASAWVSANAGTGKTHVLTRRVLRLLLDGTPPERILALTYTKSAAAEMSKRVFAQLAAWVTAGDEKLKPALAELIGRPPTPAEMQRARQLFAIAIETPGGLKVQTIHAFCERLLQRFPIEAGVAPGFVILDDHERRALLAEAADAVLGEAAGGVDPPLARALRTTVAFATDTNVDQLLQEVLREQDWLAAAVRLDEGDETFAAVEEIYRKAIGLDARSRTEEVEARLAALLSEGELRRIAAALASSRSSSDVKAAERVAAVLRANGPATRIEALCAVFLTDDGGPRKNLLTKAVAADHPDVLAALLRAQAQCQALDEERRKLALVDAAMAVLHLGKAVLQRYGEAKARRAALDFEDLVARAASLLGSSEAVEWVLYKLDGGLDHVLVDEAQDTSPLQWQVIRALAEEFFSGAGAREVVRTVFAVGDEKQSIYGFQGAAPSMFATMGESFARRAELGGSPWRRVPLTLSFRAVEPLLAAVDRVFCAPERTPGVGAVGSPPEHVAHRSGHAGLIELWPTETLQAPARTEPWSPLEEASASSPVARLAARIAETIGGWLERGEKLASENRPIRAGDILILVRKRTPFAPAMISALKARGLKVAGADRLILTEQIAVQDLMALGDFLTLPEDDLALAAILKSPLFGLDDDDLTMLAPARKGSLWQELVARGSAERRFGDAARVLQRWRGQSEVTPPFELYASLLDGQGMRARMLDRLGAEAADAIDEFLNLALAYDQGAAPSLQGFLGWLRASTREVKRDMEQGLDEVRVMTVHGAKGLEAPIVFLPDTCSTASGRRPGSLLRLEDAKRPLNLPAPLLWPVKGTHDLDVVRTAKARVARAETEERNRLLYVALTRARDRLYVAGFEGARGRTQGCWYDIIRDGLADRLRESRAPHGRTLWRIESAQTAAPEPPKRVPTGAGRAANLPAWAGKPAPREPLITVPLAPSRLTPLESGAQGEPPRRPADRRTEPAILPPAVLAEDQRFLRGTLTHALLEHLPTLPGDRWEIAAEAFLASRAARLSPAVRRSIVAETLAVLRAPGFAALFGPEARAEVAIAAEIPHPQGSGPALRISGKIDRLVRDGNGVLIVDYKTNRPPPVDPAQVAEAYLLQLAAYRLAIARIFPGTRVRAALLWTDGARIMEIPENVLNAAGQRLWQPSPA